MAQIKARLKQVRLKNISKFKEEQTVNFKAGNTFTFIGKNESGTEGFIEAIRRCCETNINHSFSCTYEENPSPIAVCTFASEMGDVEENENTSNIDKDDSKSNVNVQSRISQRDEEILKTNVEPTKERIAHSREIPGIASNSIVYGGSTKSQTLVSIYMQRKVNSSPQEAIKVLVLRKGNTFSSASIVLSNIEDKRLVRHQPSAILDQNDCERIITENVDLETLIEILEKLLDGERDDLKIDENKFDNIFHEFVDLEFLFQYRVTGLQSSEQIKTCPYEVNYKQASSNSYVIHEFLKNRNKKESCYDNKLEEKIFERLNINMDVEFKYDEEKELLSVVIGNVKHSILKAPDAILAAKYLSITLSKRKAILIIAELGRDMHLAMKRRMINLVFQDKEMLGGAMVILTSHSKDFLTPTNLEHTFIVMNNVDDGFQILPAKPDNKVNGKGYLSCSFLSMLVDCDRILFVEGLSDYIFVETMLHMIMNNKHLRKAFLKALQEEPKCPSPEQLMSFLLSLNIEKMDGCGNVSKVNNACKDLQMLDKRYFLLDNDTIPNIGKHLDIVFTGPKSSYLDALEENGTFLWDKISETVKETKTSETVKDTTTEKDGGKMNTPGCTEDVIVRFSMHHDLHYHAKLPKQCDIESCKGLENLLVEKNVTVKGNGDRLKIKGKFLLAEHLTHEDILTIVNRYLECSISNREGQIWRLLKFIGAKASET